MASGGLTSVLILLAVTVAAVWLLRRARMPAALGYLLTGVFVGPHLLDWVHNTATTKGLAEFGIVFLLFTLGLEFSLPRLIAMRREVFLLGGIQVLVSLVLAAVGLSFFAGAKPVVAVLLGGAVAMSSTALVAKQLGEQLELQKTHGRLAIGILLFQDLAVIPLLILIPMLAGEGGSPWETIAIVIGKGLLVILAMFLAARIVVRPLMHEIARRGSSELFLLASLLITLGAAWATRGLGLSLALGAFLAGAMLGETAWRHQVEASIRPFRDILLGLFFITVGMYADPRQYLGHAPEIILGTVALIVFKTAIVTAASRLLRANFTAALRTGLVLGQAGEFGLVLLALGLSHGYLVGDVAQIALNILVLSMLVSPLLVRYNADIARFLSPAARGVVARDADTEALALQESHAAGHVLLAGFGRVGQNLARFLDAEGFPYVALDLDPGRVRDAHDGGDPVYYGDARNPAVLVAAGIERARAVVVAYNDVNSALAVIRATREVRPDVPILARTSDDARLEELRAAGADEVIPETLEASLMIGSHLLATLGVPMRRILRQVSDVRAGRYSLMRNVYRRSGAEALDMDHAFRGQLNAVTLVGNAHGIGRSLGALDLEALGVGVTALRRDGVVGREPGPETVLREGDTLVLYGTPEEAKRAEDRLLAG
ncbi:MAG TPA: cation:proton antiporter [Gammaproteobacteria bacterium]|nr:cation:proton antiporter [Gammaproteobacteria bacterium]